MTQERPIRFAVVGDTHADDSSRFDEHNEVMAWIADDARRRGCCVMLHAGDVFERRSTSRERLAVADWMRRVAETMSLVMIAGNHDDPLDIELLGRVRRGGESSVTIRTATRAASILISGPGHYDVLQVHCLPWPRKGNIAALLAEGATVDSVDAGTVEALRNVLRGFAASRSHQNTPSIVLAHCMVRGSRASNSQPPLVGMDFELGVEDLALAKADFYALGHIHMGQQWETADGTTVAYTSSPRRCNFGELEEKTYLVLEWDPVIRRITWERVVNSRAQMFHVAGTYIPQVDERILPEHGGGGPDALMLPGDLPDSFEGGEVRLRYAVRAEDRVAARAKATRMREMMLERGASAVVVEEEITVETRARAPEVALATSTADKLRAYWAQQPEPPPEASRSGILDKLATVEEAAS